MRLTTKDVRRVARRTIEVLEAGGYKCCVFGSLACSIWGMDRTPNDVDIVVFGGTHDREGLKAYIANNHDRFSLEDAKTPGAEYKVLYFIVHRGWGLKCKVDILTTGERSPLHIPRVPLEHIRYPGGYDIPVLPLLVVLMLKIQGWRVHRKSKMWRYLQKVPQDIEDIRKLLEMTDEDDELRNLYWLQKWFLLRARSWVKFYTKHLPETADSFRELGFEVYIQ